MVIGTDMDHYVTLPEVKDCVLTSALKDIVTGVKGLIVAANDGSFKAGIAMALPCWPSTTTWIARCRLMSKPS